MKKRMPKLSYVTCVGVLWEAVWKVSRGASFCSQLISDKGKCWIFVFKIKGSTMNLEQDFIVGKVTYFETVLPEPAMRY